MSPSGHQRLNAQSSQEPSGTDIAYLAKVVDSRIYVEDARTRTRLSPLNNIPLFANPLSYTPVKKAVSRESQSVPPPTILHMVVTSPRHTTAITRISMSKPYNPIVSMLSSRGRPTHVYNCFPHHGYMWNYGILPQTWQDIDILNTENESGRRICPGDMELAGPVHVCEIGGAISYVGEVKQVKILGVFAVTGIDGNATPEPSPGGSVCQDVEWQLIAIDVRDPLASRLEDIKDVERWCPGLVHATGEWFRIQSIPKGKSESRLIFGPKPKDAVFATKVVYTCHEAWASLKTTPSSSLRSPSSSYSMMATTDTDRTSVETPGGKRFGPVLPVDVETDQKRPEYPPYTREASHDNSWRATSRAVALVADPASAGTLGEGHLLR